MSESPTEGESAQRTCDVVVIGGGPAGIATAIALTRLGRSVVVLERTRYERPRAGETLSGEVGPLLRALGAWDDFAAIAPIPFCSVQSAWGGPELAEHSSIFRPFGDGWHVDRATFDHMLAGCAARAGVAVELGTGDCSVARLDGSWRVRPVVGPVVTARFLIDASGRGAPATIEHVPPRHWLRADRQLAVVGKLHAPATPLEPMLLLEAVEDGWWYSAPQPDGTLLVVLITDADLYPLRGRSGRASHFRERLGRSLHTAARAAGATLTAPPWIGRSDSGLLLPDRGPGWRAIGDSAMACDPLAGDGVYRALRDGLAVAPEIDRAVAEPDAAVDAAALPERFRAYLEIRARYYAREARWPQAPFWARRRPLDFGAAPVLLDPRKVLRWDGAALARARVAPVEALIPFHALRSVLGRLRQPTPAHEALTLLRAEAPVGDRRLLVGLQLLVSLGCVAIDDQVQLPA